MSFLQLTAKDEDIDWNPEWRWPRQSYVDPRLVRSLSGNVDEAKTSFYALVGAVGLLAITYLALRGEKMV